MPTIDLILSGFDLMLLGMGVVFGFLIILVYSKMADSGQEIQEHKPVTPIIQSSAGSKVELVAVISAAISRYRATHG